MPSAAASAITLVKISIERIASSLPGIPMVTSSGSQLLSRIAITGIPSFLASVIARCSLMVSTTQSALGVFAMLRIPPSDFSSLSRSRRKISSSFLVNDDLLASSKSIVSSSFRRWMRLFTVLKFVRSPPNQRWLIYG